MLCWVSSSSGPEPSLTFWAVAAAGGAHQKRLLALCLSREQLGGAGQPPAGLSSCSHLVMNRTQHPKGRVKLWPQALVLLTLRLGSPTDCVSCDNKRASTLTECKGEMLHEIDFHYRQQTHGWDTSWDSWIISQKLFEWTFACGILCAKILIGHLQFQQDWIECHKVHFIQ